MSRHAHRTRQNRRGTAFESLEARRLLKAAIDVPAPLPAHPATPDKQPVVEQAHQTPAGNWQRPQTPILFEGDEVEPDFVVNSKWPQPGGLGTPVSLTYSYSNAFGALGGLSNGQISASIEEALQLWSAIAPLRFTQVSDAGPMPTSAETNYSAAGTPQLRFGQHTMDGPFNVLAHAYYPGTGTGLDGDTHFDPAESWSTDPSAGIDLIEVATHETGHALGLAHQSASINAIMNPIYGARFDGPGSGFLLADDMSGIQADYGAGFGYVLSSTGTLYLSGTEGNNVITLSVSGGTITGTSSGFGAFTRSTAGVSQIVINGRGGNDIIRIESNGGITTRVNSGDGNDFIDFSFGARDLDNITGNTSVYGGAGDDDIFVYDNNNAVAAIYDVTLARFDRPGWGGFYYGADVESETMTTGTGIDTVNVLSTYQNQPVFLNSAGGNDTVNVGNSTNGVQSIRADVRVDNAPAFTTLNVNDTGNTTPQGTVIDVAGGLTQITGIAPATIRANNNDVQFINLTTGFGADTVDVLRNTESLALNSAGGVDTVYVGNVTNGVQSITGNVSVRNTPSFSRLMITDAANTVGKTAGMDVVFIAAQLHGRVVGLAPAQIDYRIADITDPITIHAGSGDDTFNVATTPNQRTIALNARAGQDTVNVSLTGSTSALLVNAGADTDTINVVGTQVAGPVTVLPSPGDDDVLVNNDGIGIAEVIFNATQRLGLLSVRAGGTATLTSGGSKVLTATSLNVSGTGVLDLNDNDMIVDYAGASPLASIGNMLASGYAGGAWNGPGINSSFAAADNNSALGYAEASELFSSFPATFSGQSVDNTAVLIKYTFYGDANLDGSVNLQDFNRLAGNFGQAGKRWSQGDFNFDGTVNLIDFNKLAAHFGASGLSPDGGASEGAPGDFEELPSLEDLLASST